MNREEIRERLRSGYMFSLEGKAREDTQSLLVQLETAEALLKRCEPIIEFYHYPVLQDRIAEYFQEQAEISPLEGDVPPPGAQT